jgi:hypothetical protein
MDDYLLYKKPPSKKAVSSNKEFRNHILCINEANITSHETKSRSLFQSGEHFKKDYSGIGIKER